mmetsp:Transcript_33041/g.50639  ORF Transcript_33041/g.50639 Transcript_33041/m.50639 type:complete len:97 (+) Transcript_33041:2807-3097(+)
MGSVPLVNTMILDFEAMTLSFSIPASSSMKSTYGGSHSIDVLLIDTEGGEESSSLQVSLIFSETEEEEEEEAVELPDDSGIIGEVFIVRASLDDID